MASLLKKLRDFRSRKRANADRKDPKNNASLQEGTHSVIQTKPGKSTTPEHNQTSRMCDRCARINLRNIVNSASARLPNKDSLLHFRERGDLKEDEYARLGLRRDLRFQTNCGCCKLLEYLIPSQPSHEETELFLLPARSLHRTEPGVATAAYSDGRYANLLFIAESERTDRCTADEYPGPPCHEVADAAGYLDDDNAMPVRLVESSSLNLDLYYTWLKNCEANHAESCGLYDWPQLNRIRLIDVNSMEVIPYPGYCRYMALSYVWGRQPQAIQKDGSRLVRVPKIVSDAIEFVKLMKEQYLWVDSVSSIFGLLSPSLTLMIDMYQSGRRE